MSEAAYNRIVQSIFDAVLDERMTDLAIQAIAEYAGAAGASYVLVNKLTGQVSSVVRTGSFTGNRGEYLSHFAKIDPFRLLQEESEVGHLLVLSECVPQTALRHDEWYSDYILKGGLCDLIGCKLAESLSHIVILGLHRAIGDPDPFPRDIRALRNLIAPLCNAARLHLSLIDMGVRPSLDVDGFMNLAGAVIFTDACGRIIETNALSDDLLRRSDGLTIRNGQICAARNFETAKLNWLIAAAVGGAMGPSAGCMLVGRDGVRPALIVRVAPVSAARGGYDMPLAMIVVSVPVEHRVSERELAELYGLSHAESRLALALECGKRLTDLIADFGVQITTLRTQLSSILKKCGVERQSDLVRLIAGIPVPSPLPTRSPEIASSAPYAGVR